MEKVPFSYLRYITTYDLFDNLHLRNRAKTQEITQKSGAYFITNSLSPLPEETLTCKNNSSIYEQRSAIEFSKLSRKKDFIGFHYVCYCLCKNSVL
jgi:hypothetical protein